jgi:hypothetical protein
VRDVWTDKMTPQDWQAHALVRVAPPVDVGAISRYLFYRFGKANMQPLNEDLTLSFDALSDTIYAFDRAKIGCGKGVLFIEFKLGSDQPKPGQRKHLESLGNLSSEATVVIIYLSGMEYTDPHTELVARIFDPTGALEVYREVKVDGRALREWVKAYGVPKEDILRAIGNWYSTGQFTRRAI